MVSGIATEEEDAQEPHNHGSTDPVGRVDRSRNHSAIGDLECSGTQSILHAGFFGFETAYHRHVNSLLLNLRFFESIRDDYRLALVLRTILKAERPWIIDLMWQFRHRMLHLRFSEILLVLFRFLKRHPELISLEDMLRLLRKAEAYQPDETRKRSLTELAAGILVQNDRLSRAYDILSQPVLMQYSRVEIVRQGHDKFLGLIRKAQLLSQLSETDSFAMHELHYLEHPTFRRYENNPAIWARTGRTSREIASEAATHFHQYLDQNPKDTAVVLHLIELYMTEGKETDAIQLARVQAQRCTRDFDAQSQYLSLVLIQIERLRADEQIQVDRPLYTLLGDAVMCCRNLLVLDPQCYNALRVVMQMLHHYGEDIRQSWPMETLDCLVQFVNGSYQNEEPYTSFRVLCLKHLEDMMFRMAMHLLSEDSDHRMTHAVEMWHDGIYTLQRKLRHSIECDSMISDAYRGKVEELHVCSLNIVCDLVLRSTNEIQASSVQTLLATRSIPCSDVAHPYEWIFERVQMFYNALIRFPPQYV